MKKILKYIFLVLLAYSMVIGCSTTTKEDQLVEGRKSFESGNHQGAIVYFKNALEKDPNYFEARYELALTYLELKHFERAEKELLKVSVQSPGYRDVNKLISKVLIATDRPAEAVPAIERHLSANPEDIEAMVLLGKAEAASGKLSEAEGHLKKTLEIDPANNPAKVELAKIYLRIGSVGAAKGLLNQVIEEDPKYVLAYYLLASQERIEGNDDVALGVYARLMKEVPTDIRGPYISGLLYFFRGDREKTRAMAEHLAANQPEQPTSQILLGLSFYLEEQYRDALIHLQKAAAIEQRLTVNYFLGLTHFKLSEFELALTMFQRCLDISGDAVEPRIMLAMTYMKQNRPLEAEVEARRVIKLNSVNALAYNILGSALMSQGKFDEGMEALEWATRLEPDLADAHFKKGLFAFREGGMDAEAEQSLLKALELSPEVLNTRLVLAAHYMQRKDYPAALDTLREGIAGDKNDAIIYTLIAQIQFKQQKFDDAVDNLKKASEIRPGLIGPYFNLAAYYTTKGDYLQALAEYERVLTLKPDNLKALMACGQLSFLLGDKLKGEEFFKKVSASGQEGSYRPLLYYYISEGRRSEAHELLDREFAGNRLTSALYEEKGQLLLTENKYMPALKIFQDMEKVDPMRSLRLRVSTLLEMGEIEKARKLSEETRAASPDSALGYLLLSSVKSAEGEKAASLQVLEDALVKVTEVTPVKRAIASLYHELGDDNRAQEIFEEILAGEPENVAVLYSLATIFDLGGNKGKAEEGYKRILELSPNHVLALNNLAYLYADSYDNVESAFPLAVKAYRIDPINPAIMETVGFVLYKQGRFDKAKPLLESALKRLGPNPTASYHLALVMKESGERAEAERLLREALDMGDFPERKRAEKLLSEVAL